MAPSKRGNQDTVISHDEQVLHCPLCITELDSTERAWAPCACGYQLCLFCYDRIKSEFNNLCPGCRTPYDSDFQVNLVQRKEAAALTQQASSPTHVSSAAEPSCQHAATFTAAAAGPGISPGPASPGRDLHIDQEQFWPSLSTAAQSTKGSTAASSTATTSRHSSPRDTPSPPPVATHSTGWAGKGYSQQYQQEGGEQQHPEHLQNEGSTSSSSATTATTPQSPASSVVAYRAHTTSSVVELLQGTCHVSLVPSALATPPLDEEGANLAVSLQEAVKAGSISIKQAAASLVSYLRHKQHRTPSPHVALGQQLLQSPSSDGGDLGLAANAGRASVFGGGLFSERSPLRSPQCGQAVESSPSIPISKAPTFAQWGRADSLISAMSGLALSDAGLFDGWSSPQHSPQQQQQHPRGTGRLPLYARAPAVAGEVSLSNQQGAGGSFPGFQPTSPLQQRAPGILMSPPGFSRNRQQVSVQHL